MESNMMMNGGLASELSQIKKMMMYNDSTTEEPELITNQKNHAVS